MNMENRLAGRKATSALSHGDYFVHQGSRVRFLHRTGYPRSTRYGVYQDAWVQGASGDPRKVALNTAGSVEIA
jgi:hypothetical protein